MGKRNYTEENGNTAIDTEPDIKPGRGC